MTGRGGDGLAARGSAESAAAAAGRTTAALLVVAGVVTMLSAVQPEPAGVNRAGVLLVGLTAVALGALVAVIPWRRWRLEVTLVAVPVAFVLIALHNILGAADPYRYGLFYLVVFAWLGVYHRRGTSLLVAPLAVVAYVVPLAVTRASGYAYLSTTYAIPLYVLVGEMISWQNARVNALQRSLAHLATHDPLTGLANRALLTEHLADLAEPGSGRPAPDVAVLFVDIDDCKRVNDELGHQAGDEALVEVARAVEQAAGVNGLAARIAGDEFVLAVVDDLPEVAVNAAAARLLARVAEIRTAGGAPVQVSIGTAYGPAGDVDRLIRLADAAMYRAKRSHKPVPACQAEGVQVGADEERGRHDTRQRRADSG